MKPKIHPAYDEILVRCITCGNTFITRSTRTDLPKTDHQGKSYPTMTLDICSSCHPFYSGKQMLVDTAGRVEKFMRRYGQKAPGGTPAPQPAAQEAKQ